MMLALARACAREGRRPARDVVLAFTADEEDSAEYGVGLAGRAASPTCSTAAPRRSASPAATPSTPAAACGSTRSAPASGARRGCGSPRAGRAGHGSRRQRRQRGRRAGRRGRPDRRAPVAGAAHADGPGRLDRASVRRVGVEVDPDEPDLDVGRPRSSGSARRPGWSMHTVRNSANPTMLAAGYKVNVIPGSADGARRRAGAARHARRVRVRRWTSSPATDVDVGVPAPRGAAGGAGRLADVRRDAGGARWRRTRARTSCRTAWPAAPTPSSSPASGSPATASRRCGCRRGLRLPRRSTAWTNGCRSTGWSSASGCSTGSWRPADDRRAGVRRLAVPHRRAGWPR